MLLLLGFDKLASSRTKKLILLYTTISLVSILLGGGLALWWNPSLLPSMFKTQSNQPQGKWFQFRRNENEKSIQGLGYLSGYEKSELKGIVLNKSSKTSDGLNFYVSGHGPEAMLMDMSGKVVHKWRFPWKKAFPDLPENIQQQKGFPTQDGVAGSYFNKAYLYPNGDILAIYEEFGVVKLDKDSNLLWAKPIRAHHDIWVGPEGKIYVLTLKKTDRDSFHFRRQLRAKSLFSDFVTVLSPEGETLEEYSILEAFKNSEFAPALKLVHTLDIFHTNTLQVLSDLPSGMPEAFQEGRVLISMRRLNFVGLMDLEKKAIVWGRLSRRTQGQHDPRVTPNGNILLYDNRAGGGYSRILELDPRTWTIQWMLSGKADVPFYSVCCGRNQILPNGNILITDTDTGRAFEVTREKEPVWEYYNPERLENKSNYIAAIYSFERYPRDYFSSWLEEKL